MNGALVITGPTASGKTALTLQVATAVEAEIISADSAQVYRGMDIGTAKPEPEVLQQVPHHLIDIRDPADPYSAADFRRDVLQLVPEICAKGKLPIISGGTMLYLKALKNGLANLPQANEEIRSDILRSAEHHGWAFMHKALSGFDPESAARIKPGDSQRLQRAIEVYRITGRTLSELQQTPGSKCPFPLLEIAVMPADRALLHQHIEQRFDAMLAAGLIDEVATLMQNESLHEGLPAIKAVGYRQVWAHLRGEISLTEMREKALAATRQLAKRQYTWLRSWQDLTVLESADHLETLKILSASTILQISPR